MATELLKHSSFTCHLVIELDCFDYNVLFLLPKAQLIDWYPHVSQSFSWRGGLACELRTVHMDVYVEFADDVRHIFLDELDSGVVIQYAVSLMSSCRKLAQRECTSHEFRRSYLCLDHIPIIPSGELASGRVNKAIVDSS